MNSELVERIVEAVLYEGYVLYPYRSTALKNRQRWNFGVLHPDSCLDLQSAGERSWMQTECIATADENTLLQVDVRFLHLQKRRAALLSRPARHRQEINRNLLQWVDTLQIAGKSYESWEEAVERHCTLPALRLNELRAGPHHAEFAFGPEELLEPLYDDDGFIPGVLVRSRSSIKGCVDISAEPAEEGLFKFSVSVRNLTPVASPPAQIRDRMLPQSMLSTHTILILHQGNFVSLLDTPDQYQAAAAACRNLGTWPVLAGEDGATDCMLSSPIILYDYPQVAPESAANLFDGTEIDEMLALRIMTLTEDEKVRMARADELTRRILERTGNLSEQELLDLHGALRPASEGKDPA